MKETENNEIKERGLKKIDRWNDRRYERKYQREAAERNSKKVDKIFPKMNIRRRIKGI